MVAVLAMFPTTMLGVGASSARTEHARCSSVLLLLFVDKLIVEYPSAESTDTYTDARASP